jgi:hypothetical protein
MTDGSTRKPFPSRALPLALASCAILAGRLVFSRAQALAATAEPTIESESATNVTEHAAALQATIDPNGLEATYAFWLAHEVCITSAVAGDGKQCYISVMGPLSEGHISAGTQPATVSAIVTDLEADPTGLWCGEPGVTCEESEPIKPKPKTAAQLRVEKLATALTRCKKKQKASKQRASCERRAKTAYAPTKNKRSTRR